MFVCVCICWFVCVSPSVSCMLCVFHSSCSSFSSTPILLLNAFSLFLLLVRSFFYSSSFSSVLLLLPIIMMQFILVGSPSSRVIRSIRPSSTPYQLRPRWVICVREWMSAWMCLPERERQDWLWGREWISEFVHKNGEKEAEGHRAMREREISTIPQRDPFTPVVLFCCPLFFTWFYRLWSSILFRSSLRFAQQSQPPFPRQHSLTVSEGAPPPPPPIAEGAVPVPASHLPPGAIGYALPAGFLGKRASMKMAMPMPAPPAGAPGSAAPPAPAVGPCKQCGCTNYSKDPFKNRCSNCFHSH